MLRYMKRIKKIGLILNLSAGVLSAQTTYVIDQLGKSAT